MAKKEKALYWTSVSTYENCPKQFLWKYGQKGYDLGAGDGRPKPRPEKRSEHHMLMGTVLQYGVERLYNDELWKRLMAANAEDRWDTPKLVRVLTEHLQFKMQQQLKRRFIDWRESLSHRELEQVCVDGVVGYLKTMAHHQLIGEYARAEQLFVGHIENKVPVGARVDMIIRRNRRPGRKLVGVTILDGKNSKHKGKYSSPDQLRWYALLFYLNYGALPDRIGFVYYRFPYGMKNPSTGEVEEGIEWVSFDRDDIVGLAQRGVDVYLGIKAQKFQANPKPPYCKWCDWQSVCQERQDQIKVNRRKRGKRKPKADDLPQFVPDESGFQEL